MFYLDFNPSKYEIREDLESLLHYNICMWEEVYGTKDAEHIIADRFFGVINRAYQTTGKQVGVLVDEYDKPLLETMSGNPALHES